MAWGDKNISVAKAQERKEVVEATGDMSWLDDTTESILIFGPPKHGKTFSYCSYIQSVLSKGKKVYIISTDNGVPRTVTKYFGGLEKTKALFGSNVLFKHVFSIDETRTYYKSIEDNLDKGDLIIVDLLSQFYEWTQIDFVEHISQGHVTDYVMGAMSDPKKFGLLEGSKWNYIKANHKFVEDIIVRKRCNIIGVCTEKDTEGEKAIGGAKTTDKLKQLGFEGMSVRAGGQKEIPYLFDTMIRIGVVSAGQYACQIIGDRGHNPTGKLILYGTDLKACVDKYREEN